jgi:hypothetical protein
LAHSDFKLTGEFKFELCEIGRKVCVLGFDSSLKMKKWRKALQLAIDDAGSPEEKQLALAAIKKVQEESSASPKKKDKDKDSKDAPKEKEKDSKPKERMIKRTKSKPLVGPSVKKIAERFEQPQKNNQIASRIKKLTTTEKENLKKPSNWNEICVWPLNKKS